MDRGRTAGEFGRLNRSPLLKPADAAAVWSITCFYVRPDHRRTGITGRLIDGAIDLAVSHHATALEAYPLDTGSGHTTDRVVYMRTPDMFIGAGFVEITRRRHRPIMRLQLPR